MFPSIDGEKRSVIKWLHLYTQTSNSEMASGLELQHKDLEEYVQYLNEATKKSTSVKHHSLEFKQRECASQKIYLESHSFPQCFHLYQQKIKQHCASFLMVDLMLQALWHDCGGQDWVFKVHKQLIMCGSCGCRDKSLSLPSTQSHRIKMHISKHSKLWKVGLDH